VIWIGRVVKWSDDLLLIVTCGICFGLEHEVK
jgi:hypothetical protein